MKTRDDNDFKLKPRPPRSGDRQRSETFLRRVHLEIGRAGSIGRDAQKGHRPGARTGRGFAATRLGADTANPRNRRVIVKARVVRLKGTGTEAVAAHLRYIAREGVGRDKEAPNLPYDATSDRVDLEAFRSRGCKDRHQFRFIIAPEDAVELSDLRAFTRTLMERVAGDLGTRLDWAAVDHWDTDNPHTHVVLHGRDPSGKALIIAGEYIARGMRMRAAELATSWLGPRTDAEMQASLSREIEAERWTSLDRELKSRARDGHLPVDFASRRPATARQRAQLVGRLAYLQRLGLAQVDAQGDWWLRQDGEDVLRRLGERGDIIRTMQRAFGQAQRELAIFDPSSAVQPVVGRIADMGLAADFGDRSYIVVDGIDGRGHYVALPSAAALQDLPVGGIVDVRPAPEHTADRNIVDASVNGLYVPRRHLARLRTTPAHREAAAEIVASHVRRLEALRRARIVERVSDGLWRIPPDLVHRGREYDFRRHGGTSVRLRCHLPIERQIRAIGATWLDQQLVDSEQPSAPVGFSVQVKPAIQARQDFLIEHGFAQRRGSQVLLASDLLETLRARELMSAGKSIAAEIGLPHRAVRDGTRVSGTYRRSVQLASGRFAVLDDALGFSLVPWRPVLETRLGQAVAATVHDGHVVWHLGRARGPSIG